MRIAQCLPQRHTPLWARWSVAHRQSYTELASSLAKDKRAEREELLKDVAEATVGGGAMAMPSARLAGRDLVRINGLT